MVALNLVSDDIGGGGGGGGGRIALYMHMFLSHGI